MHRLCGVVEKRLSENSFLVGNEFTIADIANWCWLKSLEANSFDMAKYPLIKAYNQKIASRPAVVKGLARLKRE